MDTNNRLFVKFIYNKARKNTCIMCERFHMWNVKSSCKTTKENMSSLISKQFGELSRVGLHLRQRENNHPILHNWYRKWMSIHHCHLRNQYQYYLRQFRLSLLL